VTPDENVAYMEGIARLAALGGEAMANAMAEYIARRISDDTLRRRRHAPGQYYKARPGDPPAYASGSLADSVTWQAVSAGMRASAVVTSDDKRAGLMEFGGCVLTSHSGSVLKWRDSGRPDNPSGWWSHRRLPLVGTWPAHPFVGPTVEDAIADGELARVAIAAFVPFDP
jgi:hypothetical protein